MKLNNNIISQLAFQSRWTELLESLNWSEEDATKLLELVSLKIKESKSTNVDDVKSEISSLVIFLGHPEKVSDIVLSIVETIINKHIKEFTN